MKTTILRNTLRTGVSASILGLALISAPSFAQEAPEDAVADEEVTEEAPAIVVTGSRIATSSLNSPSPLQVIDSTAIRQSAVVNLQEVLLENPVFGSPGISRTNSNFSTASAGVATVDLRNLGTARTLVLVNGRRFVAGVPGSSAVDLNVIPTQFIDRVDILTGGASAVYGSDAVAGVVNIITKDDFEGIELTGQYGISEESDDIRRQLNVTLGGNFADGRGNIVTHIGYSSEGAVFSRDRERSAVDQISLGLFGDPNDFFEIVRPFNSSFAPQGRFFNLPGVTAGTFDANNNFIPGFSTNGTATRPADGFNRQAFRTIAIPTERYLVSTNARYEISDSVEAFVESSYAKTITSTELEPFPLDSFDLFPATGGFFNVEGLDDNDAPFINPFVPAALLATLVDNNGDGLRDVAFTRRLSDVAARGNDANRDTFRILVGARGEFLEDWNWDVFYSYGQTTESQVSSGQFNVASFREALNITADANGNLVCSDLNAREEGCLPANVFGANTISPEALVFFDAPGFLNTSTTQKLAGANLSGNLGDWWGAGDIGIAVGGEYREEFSDSQFDALQAAGLNGGNAIPRTIGSFDVYEAYIEARIPILTDTFIHELSVSGAGRVSDYSTVGTVYSYNAGVDFAPIEDIRFTAIWARSTRAPNINELFSPPSQTFPTGLQDPCDGITAASTGTLATTCLADPGVAANVAANGSFTLNQSDIQGISGFNRGNPVLNEEQGDSFTARVIINPRSIDALRNFGLTVNYYNIRVADAIVGTPRQFILDQCFAENNQTFCDFVTRRATAVGSNSAGSLEFIDSAVTNSGGIQTEGIDVTLNYSQNLEDIGLAGNFSLGVSYSHLIDGFVIPLPDEDPDFFAGEVGAAQDRFFVSANYAIGDFDFTFRGTYTGASFLDDQFLAGFEDPNDPNDDVTGLARDSELGRIGAQFISDIQGRFTVNETFEFFGGVDNLFDNEPPLVITGLPGNSTGTETAAGVYDPIGRRFYMGLRLRF